MFIYSLAATRWNDAAAPSPEAGLWWSLAVTKIINWGRRKHRWSWQLDGGRDNNSS